LVLRGLQKSGDSEQGASSQRALFLGFAREVAKGLDLLKSRRIVLALQRGNQAANGLFGFGHGIVKGFLHLGGDLFHRERRRWTWIFAAPDKSEEGHPAKKTKRIDELVLQGIHRDFALK
jgi:hypothetical protein